MILKLCITIFSKQTAHYWWFCYLIMSTDSNRFKLKKSSRDLQYFIYERVSIITDWKASQKQQIKKITHHKESHQSDKTALISCKNFLGFYKAPLHNDFYAQWDKMSHIKFIPHSRFAQDEAFAFKFISAWCLLNLVYGWFAYFLLWIHTFMRESFFSIHLYYYEI